jgi:hypothetical protein
MDSINEQTFTILPFDVVILNLVQKEDNPVSFRDQGLII